MASSIKPPRGALPAVSHAVRRLLILLLGIIAFTWLEFEFYPGHTYLQGDTQLYVPMLEHLNAPGYLSRDLVATHPELTYTIYDEVTLALCEAGRLDFRKALLIQQALFRATALIGVFLLAVSAGLPDTLALLVAALLGLGATLAGPGVQLIEKEPLPRAFAFGLILLAAGLLCREKPLSAGLAAGIAVVYEPVIAAPFWLVIILALILDKSLRRLLRPAITILIVFVLLLANLAQLQPGVAEAQPLTGTISEGLAELQRFRTSYVWVSLWASREVWHYLAIWVCGLWATARIWPALNRPARWLFIALPLCGVLSVPASYLLLERLHRSVGAQIQPARTLLFTVAFGSAACAMAGARSLTARRRLEAFLWFLVAFALPLQVRLFDLLRITQFRNLLQLGFAALLSWGLIILAGRFQSTARKALALAIPVVAILAIPSITGIRDETKADREAILELSHWAETATWGSSMFLFPDAGRQMYPGIFRAEARRAVWADWESGELVSYFESAASVWWSRWQQTMQGDFSPHGLESMLPLPIDYYVLERPNRLAGIRPAFVNSEFVVYDAQDLRNAATPLHAASLKTAANR